MSKNRRRKNGKQSGTQIERDFANRGRAGGLTSIAETNGVNAASKTAASAVIARQNDPEWYDRYPSIAQVGISPFMPYSSIPTFLTLGSWVPQHVTAMRLNAGVGIETDARQLAIGELWNDIRSRLKSNLNYTLEDLTAYVSATHYARVVAKSAEAFLRMAVTATAVDPRYTATLIAAKYKYATVEEVLSDISKYGPGLRFALDNFATWMIQSVPLHDSYRVRTDMLSNNVFLENPDESAAVVVVSLDVHAYINKELPYRTFVEWQHPISYVLDEMAYIMANWDPVFYTIAADLRNAYGDAINQAWDFSLKDYSYSAVYDEVVKQQFKNATVPVTSCLAKVGNTYQRVGIPTTIPAPTGWDSLADYQEMPIGTSNVLPNGWTEVIIPHRAFANGYAVLTPTSLPASPRQYPISMPSMVQMGGEAIEVAHLMCTMQAAISEDKVTVRYNAGTGFVLAVQSVIANADNTISVVAISEHDTALNTNVPTFSILSNMWSEILPLGSIVLGAQNAQGVYYNLGNVAYDKLTVIPDINLDQMSYAATASLFRTVESFVQG